VVKLTFVLSFLLINFIEIHFHPPTPPAQNLYFYYCCLYYTVSDSFLRVGWCESICHTRLQMFCWFLCHETMLNCAIGLTACLICLFVAHYDRHFFLYFRIEKAFLLICVPLLNNFLTCFTFAWVQPKPVPNPANIAFKWP